MVEIRGVPVFLSLGKESFITVGENLFVYSQDFGRLRGSQVEIKRALEPFSKDEIVQMILDLVVEGEG